MFDSLTDETLRAAHDAARGLILVVCLLSGPVSWPLARCALRGRGLHRATA
jgi:hypothetical protein